MALKEHLTPRQDAFAMAYVETGCAAEAYRRAGYSTRQSDKSVHENASKLLTKVLPRVEALRLSHANRHEITVDSITAELEQARQMAMKSGQVSAAVAATMGKAKLHGFLTDKHEMAGKDGRDMPAINVTITRTTRDAATGIARPDV